MNVIGLDHLVITTQNLDACLDFYVRVLGMRAEKKNGRYALHFGRQKINIHRHRGEFQPAAANATYGSADVCLLMEGPVDSVAADLAASGWPIELGPVPRTGATGPITSIYVRDPDGNLIELSVAA